MATISNTPRPGYVWDSTDNVWYPIGVGGHGHSDYITQATAVNPTIIDAKGDIITATAADTPARLAVGANGEQIVADSSASTGLRYQGNYAAGKNVIQNGDFYINQRAFSSTTSSAIFIYDRWKTGYTGGTSTYSAQTFTPGTAPVAGYEGKNYLRIVTTGQSAAGDYTLVNERIEGVRTLAGQTATVSFWAKANTGTPKIGTTFLQVFGSGGSPSGAVVVNGQSTTISTSWARYSFTFTIPSISGKTIGTAGDDCLQFEIFVSAGTDFATRSGTVGIQSNTFEIWGVQVEAGSVATAFQTSTGTIQGELAACQRYYARFGGTAYNALGSGVYTSTTNCRIYIPMPVTMRTTTAFTYSAGSDFGIFNGSGNDASTAVAANSLDVNSAALDFTVTARTAGYAGIANTRTNTTAYLAFSAEL